MINQLHRIILTCLQAQPSTLADLHAVLTRYWQRSVMPAKLLRTMIEMERQGYIERINEGESSLSLYHVTSTGIKLQQILREQQETQRERADAISTASKVQHVLRPFVCYLVGWYPQRWRERYADEMLDVLKTHPVTFFTLFDLLFGIFDAYLDSHYRQARPHMSLRDSRGLGVFFLLFFCYGAFSLLFGH